MNTYASKESASSYSSPELNRMEGPTAGSGRYLQDNRAGLNAQKKQINAIATMKAVRERSPINISQQLPVIQRIKIGDEDKSITEVVALLKGDPYVVWHDEYNSLLLDFEVEDVEFKDIHALLLRMGGVLVGKAGIDQSGYEADIEDNDELSSGHEDDTESAAINWESIFEAIKKTSHIFGQLGQYDPAEVPVLYRAVEPAELQGLILSIKKTGKPSFAHKESSKGRAEKFFAPNKAYVVESMGNKGKRSWLLEIVLDPKVRSLIYNPDNTGLDENVVGDPTFKGLSKEKQNQPKAIKIKAESPKKKSGLSYKTNNIGFRKEDSLLEEFSSYIIGIKVVDKEYNLKTVRKSLLL